MLQTEREVRTMKEGKLIRRERGTDWQAAVFQGPHVPALPFGKIDGGVLDIREVLKPRYAAECVTTDQGRVQLDEKAVIRVFHEALENRVGEDLENAAAELLLTAEPKNGSSDWARFRDWAAKRKQPLDEFVIKGFGRFYANRLNRVLKDIKVPEQPQFIRHVRAIGLDL